MMRIKSVYKVLKNFLEFSIKFWKINLKAHYSTLLATPRISIVSQHVRKKLKPKKHAMPRFSISFLN